MVAAVKEKALCAEIQRVSRGSSHSGAQAAPAVGHPVQWRGTPPRKASAKENSVIVIPRQNGT